MTTVQERAAPYPKAPIVEAVIEFQVAGTMASVGDLLRVRTGDEDAYPETKNQMSVEHRLTLGPASGASFMQEQVGHVFLSGDGLQVMQVTPQRFAFSRLAPYESWEPFSAEALRLFAKYRDVAQPTDITHVALRNINRIDIPLPSVELKDYLLTGPEISPHLPQGLDGYFFQLHFPLPEHSVKATINETIVEPAAPNTTSIILDIEVSPFEWDPKAFDDGLLQLLTTLRDAKNFVFEACITDATRRLFF